MSFNAKKYAQSHGNYESMLRNMSNQSKYNDPETVTDDQLSDQRKGNDSRPIENRIVNDANTGEADKITEAALDMDQKLYNDKRNTKAWEGQVRTQDALSQAYDTNRASEIKGAEKGLASQNDSETSFWDDFVGVQMISPKTTIVDNVQGSQLQNDPTRFEKIQIKLEPGVTISEVLGDVDNIKKMVTASLNDADSMIFKIYHQAASEDRNVTSQEEQQINDITSGKARILAGQVEFIES